MTESQPTAEQSTLFPPGPHSRIWPQIEEKVKAIKSEIKGTNSEEKETRNQNSGSDQKKNIHIRPEQNEETRIKKMRRRLGTYRTTLNIPTSKS